MMRGAITAKVTALTVAICVHGAVALSLAAKEDIQAEGADGAAEVRLGNAFADMAAGSLTATRPVTSKAAQTDTSERIQTETPTPALPEERIAAAQVARPDMAARTKAGRTITETEKTNETPSTDAPEALARLAPSEALEAAPPPDRLEGSTPQSTAVTRSLRPMRRSAAFEAAHKPAQAAKSSPSPKPKVRQATPKPGNAKRNARAGAATGKPDAAARQSGTGGRQKVTGNAAASNYPGLVMRRLSRAGKPRVNARGSAFVAFTISANGGLSAVSLSRSSGSSALDQAALRLVRGAGPFPKPPQGARRNFSVKIQGR